MVKVYRLIIVFLVENYSHCFFMFILKSETVPEDTMHFKEYIMSGNSFDKGGHGSIHNISISDENQLKYFKKCVNIVVKKVNELKNFLN